jgi:transcriptional regulator with XRE-family HTH domain
MSRTHSKGNIQRFGEKLRTLRLKKGLTLQQFAESVGYTAHGYLSELETGKKTPTVDFVLSVSRAYDVPIDQLLKDELEIQLTTTETNNGD